MSLLSVGGTVLSLADSFFNQPKPLLVPVEQVQAMIARLSPADYAQLTQLIQPFDWGRGQRPENVAGKIAAELRDAQKPAEVALYNFVASRINVSAEGPSPIQTVTSIAQQAAQTGAAAATQSVANQAADAAGVTIMPDWVLFAALGFVAIMVLK